MENVQGALVDALTKRPFNEDEIDHLIERRASAKKGIDEQEESWKESVRQYHAENREARLHQWITYYRRLSESFRRRSEDCARKAAALDPGEGDR